MGGIIRGEQCDGGHRVTLDGDPLPWGAGAWLPCSGRGWLDECGKRSGRCRVQSRNPASCRRCDRCRSGNRPPLKKPR